MLIVITPRHYILTFESVQPSLIALFIKLDLDFLCAVRSPSHNIWKNSAKRIMSILNLALQGVGIFRAKIRLKISFRNTIL